MPDFTAVVDLVDRHRPRSSREGFPAHVRAAVVEAARQGLRERLSVAAMASRLRLAPPTLQRWLSSASHDPAEAQPAFLPLQPLKAPPRASTLTWTSPSGHRVDGLTLDDVADLLRRVA